MERTWRIGVFDSGFGGLDVLRGIIALMPEYDYLYLGDTARAPYGPRPSEEVYKFATHAVDYLAAHDCSLIVFACNTASSDALHTIQHIYAPEHHLDTKVLGVLIPLSEEAVGLSKKKRIGVMATDGTVRSDAFVRELQKIDPKIEVFQEACPLLVPLVEAGAYDSPDMQNALRTYIEPLLAENIDTLILGCTHYGVLEKQIRAIIGDDIAIVSAPKSVPPRLKQYLERHPEIERALGRHSSREFYTTGAPERFERLGQTFLGEPFKVKSVVLP